MALNFGMVCLDFWFLYVSIVCIILVNNSLFLGGFVNSFRASACTCFVHFTTSVKERSE